jgi:hypothetical protein
MFGRSFALPLAAILIIASLLWAVGSRSGFLATGMAPSARVSLVTPEDARPGEIIRVALVATDVQDLAGFQGTVHFDRAQLRLTGAIIGDDITRTGRGLLPLGPVLRETSAVVGAATCPAACGEPRPARVERPRPAVAGQVNLATIEFYTEQPGQYELSLDGVQLVNPQGARMPVTVSGASLQVTVP